MDKVKKTALHTLRIYLDTNMLVYSGNATLFMITAIFPLVMGTQIPIHDLARADAAKKK